MKRLLAAAAVLATFTHAAFAGELTLFSDSNFRGNRVTLDREAPNLGATSRIRSPGWAPESRTACDRQRGSWNAEMTRFIGS